MAPKSLVLPVSLLHSTILSSTLLIYPVRKPLPESLVVWRSRPTETSPPHTPPCWLLRMLLKNVRRLVLRPSTSNWEPLAVPRPRPPVQVVNLPWEPWPDPVWESAELRTSPLFHLTPQEERVVDVVEDCDCFVLITTYSSYNTLHLTVVL